MTPTCGTITAYHAGCRCDECRGAARLARATSRRNARRRALQKIRPRVQQPPLPLEELDPRRVRAADACDLDRGPGYTPAIINVHPRGDYL